MRDPLAINDQRQLLSALPADGQAESHGGMIGEVAHELEMAWFEGWLALVAGDDEHAEHRLLSAQRHHDGRPLPDVGECLDGVAKGLGAEGYARAEHPTTGRS